MRIGISLVTQERLLGAALGAALMGGMILEQRRGIYRSIADDGSTRKYSPPPKEPLFGRKTSEDVVHFWNKTVDGVVTPVIEYLSSRGW